MKEKTRRIFRNRVLYVLIFMLIILVGCKNDKTNQTPKVVIDFTSKDNQSIEISLKDTSRTLFVAVSAIISPRETFIYYQELFNYISKKINRKIEVKQRKTYGEVNQMLLNGEVDLAFICSGAYTKVRKNDAVELLVVPVCNGEPFYQAYIIANQQSDIEHFEDLKGKSFAYTDPLSNTGKLYVDYRLHELGETSDSYFSSTMFTHAHDISIQLVSKRVVDGATIDGLIYEYISTFYPERVKNIRIIEKSQYFGIPPVVVPSNLPEELKTDLRNVLLSLRKDSTGAKILDKLLIDKFIEGDDKNYDFIRKMQSLK